VNARTPETVEPRRRLLEGAARALAQQGYGATTLADIVREAGVSRRTFYEHFQTKSDCFIALYEAASANALKVLRQAIDPGHPWQTQVERAVADYLSCLAPNPALVRILFIEVLALGEPGLAARRRVNGEIADFIRDVVNGNRGGAATPHLLTPELATALVGGINELIQQAIEQDRVGQLETLVAPISRLVRAVAAGEATRP
jgi:AcrR family transcriptional regulator